jgi:hypothetical protein
LVIAIPEALRKAGIGGILSPQALAVEGRGVVLDLAGGAMNDVPLEEALQAATTAKGSALPQPRACGNPQASSAAGRVFVVDAQIEGAPAVLEIDSGATQSSIFGGSTAGRRIAGRAKAQATAYAASGKVSVPVLEGARVDAGAVTATADIDILPGTREVPCHIDGFLGMDVLKSCVLVFGPSMAAGRCESTR